jgi:CheY-like chemotaxis protein
LENPKIWPDKRCLVWLRKPIILVADDNDGVREITKLLLELKGCLVLEAADGFQAIEAARTTVPDVALIDIHMPAMDGLEVARRLRQQGSLCRVPLVAVTASSERCIEAIAAGCDECLKNLCCWTGLRISSTST